MVGKIALLACALSLSSCGGDGILPEREKLRVEKLPGKEGPQGEEGQKGTDGIDGKEGPQGPQGPEGPRGPQGETGAAGPRGAQGEQGPQGPQGPEGKAGPAGSVGPVGPKGDAGPPGPQGPQGIIGPVGPKGDSCLPEVKEHGIVWNCLKDGSEFEVRLGVPKLLACICKEPYKLITLLLPLGEINKANTMHAGKCRILQPRYDVAEGEELELTADMDMDNGYPSLYKACR